MYMTRRQKEILEFLNRYIERNGYAPTIEETAHHFGLSSLATVHKHLSNLQKKGLVKRDWNRSRALELVPTEVTVRALELPLLGRVAANSLAVSEIERLPREACREPVSSERSANFRTGTRSGWVRRNSARTRASNSSRLNGLTM